MASEVSGASVSSEAKEAPMRSEPDGDTGGDGDPRAAVEPEKESSDGSPPASAAAGGTLTTTSSMPVAQETPDDDPDEEAFQEALEYGDDDGFSDAAKASGSLNDGELMEGEEKGEPPSETQVLATVQGNSQHETVEMLSSEIPRTEETSHREVLSAVVKESAENSTSQSTETKPIEDGSVDGDEELGLHDAHEENDEGLVEESGESATPTIGAVEEERHGAEPDAADDVKIGVAAVSDQNVYPICIPAAQEMETVENPTLSIEGNPVEDETAAAGNVDRDEERADPGAQEKDGSLVDKLGESARPVIDVLLESKTANDKFDTAEEEKNGGKAEMEEVNIDVAGVAPTLSIEDNPVEDGTAAAGNVDRNEEQVDPDAPEKDGGLVEKLGKPPRRVIHVLPESKTATDEFDTAEKGTGGDKADISEVDIGTSENADSDQSVNQGSTPASQTVDESSKSTHGVNDEEMNENLIQSYSGVDTMMVYVSTGKLDGSNMRKNDLSENHEVADGKSGESSANKDDTVSDGETVFSKPSIQEKVDTASDGETVSSERSVQEIVDEKLTNESNRTANGTEANNDEPVPELVPDGQNSISAQDRQSPSITAGESRNRVTEGDDFGASGVNEDALAQLPTSVTEPEPTPSEDLIDHVQDLDQEKAEDEDENLVSDGPPRVAISTSSETAKQLMSELEEGSSSVTPHSVSDDSKDVDGQIILDSDEELVTDEEDGRHAMIDSDALIALLKAASSSTDDGGISVTSQDANRIFLVDRPAGLGSSIPSLKPTLPRPARSNLHSPSELAVAAEPDDQMTKEQKQLHEKIELIRVKFLRLVHRLGHSPEDTVVAQVLYRLSLAEGIRSGRQTGQAYSLESAKKKALLLEQDGTEDLDFSCNILVLGKSGVGKSATVNSIFGEEKSPTSAFEPATTSVKEIVGTVEGVKIRVLDTPGLRASGMDQASSRRILASIKKYTKRCPPDIVLYVDRMDTLTRDQNDLPLLRTITSALGSSIWFNAIVALAHAASAPPDGPSGSPLSYEVFVAQRSHAVQQSIRLAAGDMRLMNPVALVENHPSCRKNREGQKVLPNGLSWRSQMLLLCYSSKILSQANSLLKLQDPSPGKLFGLRLRPPPLPFLLSSLLQSRAHPKLPSDHHGDNEDSDIDLDDLSDADQGEEEEYDQLPPFKPLRKSQIAKLTKEQRRSYFDEYDYRVKLLQKKQWKEELRRLKEMKNGQKVLKDDFGLADMVEDFDQDNAPATVPVPLPDMVLPPSFDCDAPTYRYRFLEPASQFLARPVLDTHGWDHDCGYDGVSLEESLAVAGRFPAVLSAQVTKDKKEFSIHLDSSVSAKHGENGSTLAGFDIQTVGKQLSYILRGETKFKMLKKNRTTGGISVTFLGETIATGLKFEDQLSIGKQVNLGASTGAVRAQGYTAYGANLEVRLRDKDYPISQALATLGLSLMSWHGDLALGANLQSQFSIGRNSNMAVRVGLNNKRTGQITVRMSTSEQLQLALVGIIPIAISIFRSMKPGESFQY
ncbi:unnamed protein product [Musa acuminata subsp. burmannicoides]